MPGEFHLTGTVDQFTMGSPTAEQLSALTGLTIKLTANIPAGTQIPVSGGVFVVGPRSVTVLPSGQISEDGTSNGIMLLANDTSLGLNNPVQWTFTPGRTAVGTKTSVKLVEWTFQAPAPGVARSLDQLAPVPNITAIVAATIGVDQITGATAFGKSWILGDATAGRAALGIAGGNDWEQYANLAAFPATGNTLLEYLALDTGKLYRWNGSAYLQIADKAAVGLGNVDNTSDVNKPISTLTQTALDGKQPITLAATAAWAQTADYQAAPVRPALVAIGDSITANNTTITTWNGSSASRTNAVQGLGYLACAMVWNRQPANWINKGIGGQTAADGLARFDTDVTALRPQVVHEAFGTNDIATSRTAAATFADKLAMWQKAWAFGAQVVTATCPPRNTFTTAQVQEANKLNALIRKFASTNPGNFTVMDWYAVLADPLTGNYLTACTTDGTHPNSYGAWLLGKAYEPILDRVLPPAIPSLAMSNVNDVDNLMTNPLMTSTGGAVISNKGLTGPVATNWAASSTGTDATLTSVLSKVTRADGYGEWQQVNTTVVPASSSYVTVFAPPGGSWAAGDILQAYVEFETDAAGWTNGVFDAQLLCLDGSSNIINIAAAFSASTDSIILTRPEAGVLQTPPIILPPTAASVQLSVNLGGLGVARIGRIALRKLS